MSLYLLLIVLIVIYLVFMLFNKRRQGAREQQTRQDMQPGAWVMTTSGFYGQFVEQDGSVIILQTVDGTETFWDQRALARVVEQPPFATPLPGNDDEDAAAAEGQTGAADTAAPDSADAKSPAEGDLDADDTEGEGDAGKK